MRLALSIALLFLTGCQKASEDNPPVVEGVYKYPGCDEIALRNGELSFGGVKKPYKLINIKGLYYLDIDGTILYKSNGRCQLIYKSSSPAYVPMVRENGLIRMKVFSEDLHFAIYYSGPY